MVWKILSIFAAACLGASCYFAWSNQKDLAAERDRESNAKANLKAAQDVKKEGDEALIAKKTALEAVQKELAAQKEETVKLGVQVQEKEVSHGIIKGNLEQIQQQVAAVEKQIEDAGDIEKLIAQIEKLKKDHKELYQNKVKPLIQTYNVEELYELSNEREEIFAQISRL